MDFSFDVRDFKYLSQIKRFSKKITDPEIIAGLKSDKITINLSEIKQTDAAKQSRYQVGGNIYWESHIFSPNVTSFTTSGFFAEKGYVEPRASNIERNFVSILVWTGIIVVLVVVVIVVCCRKHR